MIQKKGLNSGFTIVELLIVIVVIAILAAISVVAYNGVQTRANNTQTIDAVKQFVKAYNLYAIDNGDYPNQTGCLGEGYPTGRCLSEGTAACFSTGGATNTAINTALKPYMNNQIPALSMQNIQCGGVNYRGAYAYYTSATKQVGIYMMLRGDQVCPPVSPGVVSTGKVQQDDATRCTYVLKSANTV